MFDSSSEEGAWGPPPKAKSGSHRFKPAGPPPPSPAMPLVPKATVHTGGPLASNPPGPTPGAHLPPPSSPMSSTATVFPTPLDQLR